MVAAKTIKRKRSSQPSKRNGKPEKPKLTMRSTTTPYEARNGPGATGRNGHTDTNGHSNGATNRAAKRSRKIVSLPSAPVSDRALVDRCLAGDTAAWKTLYTIFHEPLMLAIRTFLGRSALRQDLVEDIAAKVWFTLIDQDGRLLDRFDAGRGCRLGTFIAGLAKNEISRYFRAERGRNARETMACRSRESVTSDSPWQSVIGQSIAITEFLATLTPGERHYCESILLGTRDVQADEYTDTNRWQLNHRVRLKLHDFVDHS